MKIRSLLLTLVAVSLVVAAVVTGEPLLAGIAIPMAAGLLTNRADRWMDDQPWLKIELGELIARLRPSRHKRQRSRNALVRVHLQAAPRSQRNMLVLATLALLGMGAAMVFSAVTHSPGALVAETHSIGYLIRFLFFAALGLFVAFRVSRLDPARVRRHSRLILGIAFALLVAASLFGLGDVVNGSRQFVGFSAFQIQASEVMKLALVIYVASEVSRVRNHKKVLDSLPALFSSIFACMLITIEPDVGSALVCAFAVASVWLAAGTPVKRFLSNGIWLVAVPLLSVLLVSWRRASFFAFLDPRGSLSYSGFAAEQSLLGLGSGGFFGRGFGESIEKAYYLPEAHTDFILSIIGEELGVVGVIYVLALLGIVFLAGLGIARRGRNLYEKSLAVGLTTLIAGQGLLNVFAVLGLGPVTGATLPFVSYGSSSLLTDLLAVGLLLGISNSNSANERVPSWMSANHVPLSRTLADRRIGLALSIFVLMLAVAAARTLWVGTVQASGLAAQARAQQNLCGLRSGPTWSDPRSP